MVRRLKARQRRGKKARAGVGGVAGPVVVSVIRPERTPVPLLPPDAREALRAAGWELRERPLPPGAGPADLAALVGPDTPAVLTSWGCPAFTAEALAALPGLRFIGHCAGSVRSLAGPEVFGRGITVVGAAPVIARGVAEYCLAAALWSLRDLGAAARGLAAGGREGWAAGKSPESRSLWGRDVGVVGAGATGRAFIGLLRPFGCDVVVADPHLDEAGARALGVRRAGLDEACSRSVVSVHVPDLPETRGLIGAAQLARIPDGGLFINSARAGVVDHAALTARLASGSLRAVLDVFPQEPLPEDSPLRGLPGVVLTEKSAAQAPAFRHGDKPRRRPLPEHPSRSMLLAAAWQPNVGRCAGKSSGA